MIVGLSSVLWVQACGQEVHRVRTTSTKLLLVLGLKTLLRFVYLSVLKEFFSFQKGQSLSSGKMSRKMGNKRKVPAAQNAGGNPVIPAGSGDTAPFFSRLSALLMSKLSSMHSGGLESHAADTN